jgi:MFS family permease
MYMRLSPNQKTILTGQALFSVYSALTAAFIIPFALVLGATNSMIGILTASAYLAIMFAQIPGERMTEKIGRKVVYLTMSPVARLFWIVILLIPFYFNNSILMLIAFYFIIHFFEYFAEPAYLSMMSDCIPNRVRGWFFSKKNMVKMAFHTGAFFLAGFYLDFFPRDSPIGFVNFMLIGIIVGFIGSIVVGQLKVPNLDHVRTHKIRDYFRIKGNLKKYVIFMMFFHFAFLIASPFITVYMLEDLSLSYTWFVMFTLISVIVRILAQNRFGKICDTFGAKPVAALSVFGTALTPFLMFFVTPSTLWLLFIVQILNGFVWAGVDVASINMLLNVTNKRDRSFQVAAYILFASMPLIIAPLAGGWIADNVVFIVGGIPLVFLISAGLRLVSPVFLWGIEEKRVKTKAPIGTILHRIFAIHPETGLQKTIRFVKEKARR